MIVKIMNKEETRVVDCVSAFVTPDVSGPEDENGRFMIIFVFSNGKDQTLSLSLGDMIYYLNEQGKTIDKDFRMYG